VQFVRYGNLIDSNVLNGSLVVVVFMKLH